MDQGGEGNDAAGEWFIENVKEELDQPNEYFFDTATNELHLWFNGCVSLCICLSLSLTHTHTHTHTHTLSLSLSLSLSLTACVHRRSVPEPPSSITVPTLANLIVVKGTKDKPVANITIGPGIQARLTRTFSLATHFLIHI